jgi:hypothetical protein
VAAPAPSRSWPRLWTRANSTELRDAELKEAKVDGDEATVSIVGADTVRLRRVDDDWLVDERNVADTAGGGGGTAPRDEDYCFREYDVPDDISACKRGELP